MRILHVPHAYHPAIGGAELYVKRLSEELVERGHQVSVLTADLASAEGFYQLGVPRAPSASASINGVTVTRLPVRDTRYKLASALRPGAAEGRMTRAVLAGVRERFSRRLSNAVGSADVDLVMTIPHLFPNVLAVLAAHRRQRFPLVIAPLLHESDPYWPVDEVRRALGRADAVLALTDHERQRLTEAYGVPAERVFVCPPGVDVPPLVNVPRLNNRVLFLGRQAANKGLGLLGAAMRIVWASDPSAELILAGRSDPSSASVQLPSEVIHVDNPSEDEKARLLASATVVVLPSESESFGIVLLEAMAHATPVIAVDTPVTREVIDDGVTGLLSEHTAEGIATKIQELLASPDNAGRLGEHGKRRVAAERSWATTGVLVEEAYHHASAAP